MSNRIYDKTNTRNVSTLSILFILAGGSLLFIPPLIEPGLATAQTSNPSQVSIVFGASKPTNEIFYDPAEVTIKTGDTVMWVNDDISIHNLASGTPNKGPTSEFESGLMQAAGTFEHTFNNVGSIDYYCTIHPWMTGVVTIT